MIGADVSGVAPLGRQQVVEAVMVRYATAADTRDRALLESCFAASAEADYGDAIGRFGSRDALVDHLLAMLAACSETLHFMSNVAIREAAPDRLATRTYTHAIVHVPGLEAPIRTAGVYDDTLVPDGYAGWLIARRTYRAVA